MPLQHKFIAARRANDLEQAWQGTAWPWGKSPGVDQDQPFNTRCMACGKTEPDWPAPVVQHQRDLTQVKGQHQSLKIGDMMLQEIWVRDRRHTGFPHAHMIG